MNPRHRLAVRLLLITPESRILMFLSHFEPGSRLEPAWVFPGGGVEPDETLTQALVRELREETGLLVSESSVGNPIAVLEHEMPDRRVFETGTAHFFKLETESEFEPDKTFWTKEEHRDTIAHRWWSLEEILLEKPWIVPPGSMAIIQDRLAGGSSHPTKR